MDFLTQPWRGVLISQMMFRQHLHTPVFPSLTSIKVPVETASVSMGTSLDLSGVFPAFLQCRTGCPSLSNSELLYQQSHHL